MAAGADEELVGVVIVGGGICGLATALALHRKGISSLVLERAESLRATGAGITIQVNGWRALDQLKVADDLRKLAMPLSGMDKREVHDSTSTTVKVSYRSEVRCLKRSDLVETLAKKLPAGCIRFGCQVEAISLEPNTRFPVISTNDGTTIKAKLLIGCDGSNSVVAKFLGLKPVKFLPMWAARGFTIYPDGHNYGSRFLQLIGNGVNFRLIPVDDKLVSFNAILTQASKECSKGRDEEVIKEVTVQAMATATFPEEMVELVRRCEAGSMSLSQLCYRAPWNMAGEAFEQAGTVTVAGDAMHVMGPFLGQGGSCGLEDAVVLARCLAMAKDHTTMRKPKPELVVYSWETTGLRCYVKERRWRILTLSFQTFLMGRLLLLTAAASTSAGFNFNKVLIAAVMALLFRNKYRHTDYNCGSL